MQVKKFPEGEWWRGDVWFLPNELRNVVESLEGQGKSTLYGGDRYTEEQYADLERRFKGKAEYLTFAYSDYGGDVLQRLVCDRLDRFHKKPEKELTDKEREIVDGSAFVGAAYGGEEWAVWHPALVSDLKVWNTELYSRGLGWVEELFGGEYWEDALSELEMKLYDEAWDNLVESYPALKGEDELEEKMRSWLEAYCHVMPTFVDYSEGRLMEEVGAFVLNNHTSLSSDDRPLPFYWLKDEWNRAMKDADELPDAESQVKMHKQIDSAYDKALEQLGYAFAKGNAEEWSEENKNFGWLPWNK